MFFNTFVTIFRESAHMLDGSESERYHEIAYSENMSCKLETYHVNRKTCHEDHRETGIYISSKIANTQTL